MGGMSKEWKPPAEDADVFAQYKAHVEGERKLKPEMEEAADRALATGATVGQLARHTGLTPEVFRRRARKLGVQHKRPPTVGPLKQEPAELPLADTTSAGPAPERVKPPGRLGISPEVATLSYGQAKALFGRTEMSHPSWWIDHRKEINASSIPADWQYHVGVQAGVDAEIINLPGRPAGSEEAAG